jgi:lipid-A-disaccharide synthase
VHVQYVTLVNLVLGRGAIPELLLEDCYPEALASALLLLLRDSGARDAQRSAMKEALRRLGQGGPRPGHQAARAVLKVIGMQGSSDETQSAT